MSFCFRFLFSFCFSFRVRCSLLLSVFASMRTLSQNLRFLNFTYSLFSVQPARFCSSCFLIASSSIAFRFIEFHRVYRMLYNANFIEGGSLWTSKNFKLQYPLRGTSTLLVYVWHLRMLYTRIVKFINVLATFVF